MLIEAGPRLLAAFPKSLSTYAERTLARLGVTVITGKAVDHAPTEGDDGRRSHACGIGHLGAGVKAAPAASWLGIEPDRQGRIPVEPDLSVTGLNGVYVIGDCAVLNGRDGKPLPALAQVANQQGHHLGQSLRRNLADGTPLAPFRFHDRGNTAIVGRNAAVFDFGWARLKGRVGWTLWALVHIYLLTGFENRLLVTVHWLWLYLTYERGARLITGGEDTEF